MVLLLEGDYPSNPHSSCTLLLICHNKEVAQFVSLKVKERKKLDFYPTIRETDEPADPESYNIADYLSRTYE